MVTHVFDFAFNFIILFFKSHNMCSFFFNGILFYILNTVTNYEGIKVKILVFPFNWSQILQYIKYS